MKATVKLLALTSLIMFWSCSRTDDNNVTPSGSNGTAGQVIGDWKVTSYFDSGKDETDNYSGYSFTFSANGALSASHTAGSFAGTWQIGNKSSDDDNSSSRFLITIAGNKQMEDLAHNWLIVSIDDTTIRLADDNPASMEEITFTKNNQ